MSPSSGRSFVLRGGQLIDGTGSPPRPADITVANGRITEVSDPAPGRGGMDVTGLTVAPGFIDLHTHCDFSLPLYPRADSMVRQGVTTVVVGNCGHSTFPVGPGDRRELLKRYSAFLTKDLEWSWSDARGFNRVLAALPLSVNVALLVGHGTVRIAVMGFDARPATPREIEQMQTAVAVAMEAGVFGLSSGLIYPPGSYASTEELVSLATVAARYDGFYATHMRNEGPALLHAVNEALDIAGQANIALQISHHKVLGRRNWGLTTDSLKLIDRARSGGLDVMADQYPYPASSTTMTALLPTWALDGGTEQLRSRLADTIERERIRTEILEGPTDGRPKRDFEPETVMIASTSSARAGLVGQTIEDIARTSGREPVDAMLDLLAEEGGGVQVVIFAIGEEDIRRVMTHPHIAVASDGWTLHPSAGGCPHPRSYGTFARVLGHYVREERTLTLTEAIRKMTSLPAHRLRLHDRGIVRPGAQADLVVFDPAQVSERSTFTNPHQFCEGVVHVFVNGTQVVSEASDTSLAAGEVLKSTKRR